MGSNAGPRRITATERDERRVKGLCYFCDEKYTLGHTCKNPQNFMLVGDEEMDSSEFNI